MKKLTAVLFLSLSLFISRANAQEWRRTNFELYNLLAMYLPNVGELDPLVAAGGPPRYNVRTLGINSPSSDHTPSFFGNQIVFASNRNLPVQSDDQTSLFGAFNSDLFVADQRDNALVNLKPFPFNSDIKLKNESVVYSANGKIRVVVRHPYNLTNKEKRKMPIIRSSLYITKKEPTGNWGKEIPFAYNSETYTCFNPTLSPDGMRMFFTSDMPGSVGGLDLWYSDRQQDGTWSKPVNMGFGINTAGNEATPFFAYDSLMYFASDGHRGFGGLDLFVTRVNGNTFSAPQNLGESINSKKNDHGLILNPNGKQGFFVSNRPGGVGEEDIYGFDQLIPFDKGDRIKIKVLDAVAKNMIVSAEVAVIDEKGEVLRLASLSDDGTMSLQLRAGEKGQLRARAKGFKDDFIRFNATDILASNFAPEVKMELEKDPNFVDPNAALAAAKQKESEIKTTKGTEDVAVVKEAGKVYTKPTGKPTPKNKPEANAAKGDIARNKPEANPSKGDIERNKPNQNTTTKTSDVDLAKAEQAKKEEEARLKAEAEKQSELAAQKAKEQEELAKAEQAKKAEEARLKAETDKQNALATAQKAKEQEELAKAEQAKKAEEARLKAEADKQNALAAAQKAKEQEELAKAEQAKKAEEARLKAEADKQNALAAAQKAKEQEELAKAEQAKKAEEARLKAEADKQNALAAAQKAKEEQELAKAEQAKKAEEARLKAEADKQNALAAAQKAKEEQQELAKAEQAKKAEEARLKAETAKQNALAAAQKAKEKQELAKAEQAKKAEEARLKAEAAKQNALAEAQKAKEKQALAKAEQAKKAEEARLKAEAAKQNALAEAQKAKEKQALAKAEQAKKAEEARLKAEAEKQSTLAANKEAKEKTDKIITSNPKGGKNNPVAGIANNVSKESDKVFVNENDTPIENAPATKDKVKNSSNFELKQVAINSKGSEGTPTIMGNQLVYAKANEQNGISSLYVADLDNDNLSNEKPFNIPAISTGKEKSVAFSPDGYTMVFSRTTEEKISTAEGMKLVKKNGLYFSVKQANGEWGVGRPFSFNNPKYSIEQPVFSPDGKRIYYVSNMPGSKGKTDIWYSEIKEDGSWSSPINAGPNVNTKGKETSPFLAKDGSLFFASEGHEGLGGMDIFVAAVNAKGFTAPVNLGSEINSPKNEQDFVLNDTETKAFLTSNRSGSVGKEDLYAVNVLAPIEKNNSIKGIVKDRDAGKPIASAKIALIDERGSIVQRADANNDGFFNIPVKSVEQGQLRVTSSGYIDKYVPVNVGKILRQKDAIPLQIALETYAVTVFKATVKDALSMGIANATVKLVDNRTKTTIFETVTDANGSFQQEVKKTFSDESIEAVLVVQKDGYLNRQFPLENGYAVNGVSDLNDIVDLRMSKLEVGADLAKMINLSPIYFDLGKSSIRTDASVELEKIITILNDHPEMNLELRAHTDCRGSVATNLILSRKRAEETAKFIKTKITNPERIVAVGFGENNLVNNCDCDSNIDCPEEEHQLNRRTEFIIKKLK